jgi:ribosomal protein S27AE
MDKLFFVQSLLAKTNLNYNYDYDGGGGVFFGFLAFFFWFSIMAAFYVYSSLALMLIAKKTNTPNSWMAWIPVLNFYLMVKIAQKSLIWFIMFFLPFLNIVAMVLVWGEISEKRGKPAWFGLLMLVPVANLILIGVLAFSDDQSSSVQNKISGRKFCSECGASVFSSDKFCPECGAEL